MSPVLAERLSTLDSVILKSGSHEKGNAMCVMEAVAYIAGEPWSDHPYCACPVIAAFLRSWNDWLPSDADRGRLLKPLVRKLVDTRSTPNVKERRAYLALDWLIRVHTPKWLDLRPELAPHAKALRDLEEIADLAAATAAGKITAAAWDAAAAAARDAAADAAGAAAWAAAWAAGAARDAAAAAAWPAAPAWAVARAAAWAAGAARDAARAAARDAAADFLKPTTEWLQISALDLVERMIRVDQGQRRERNYEISNFDG
jgi:hypothetical protein